MARAFRFRLDVVQRLRKQAVDEHRRALAAILRRLRATEAAIREIEALLDECSRGCREGQGAGILNLNNIAVWQMYRAQLHDRLAREQDSAARITQEAAAQRDRLAGAHKQLKAVEKLRERQWERYLVELRRAEQRETDEQAVQRYHRAHDLADMMGAAT